MAKLVLLGGPVGVGKSAAMNSLANRLPGAALLDADDVWRVSDDLSTECNRNMAHSNVNAVMAGYFRAGASIGIVSWVFARPELFEPVKDGLQDFVDEVVQLYLTASPQVIADRLSARRKEQGHRYDDDALLKYSLSRLELINALPYVKIDVSILSPDEVAEEIIQVIDADNTYSV